MISPGQEAVDHRCTYRDLEHTPDDGNRWELIDGVFHVTPFPAYLHQNAQAELLVVLTNHVKTHRLGKVFSAGLMVVLDDPTGVGPDIVCISTPRLDGMRDDGFHGAPDLIVEILSSKPLLDKFVKYQKYAAAGVPHYWIVDTTAKQLAAYRLEGDRYRLVAEPQSEATFEPELFPGLSIALGDLWI